MIPRGKPVNGLPGIHNSRLSSWFCFGGLVELGQLLNDGFDGLSPKTPGLTGEQFLPNFLNQG
jgi:hypothetical protein